MNTKNYLNIIIGLIFLQCIILVNAKKCYVKVSKEIGNSNNKNIYVPVHQEEVSNTFNEDSELSENEISNNEENIDLENESSSINVTTDENINQNTFSTITLSTSEISEFESETETVTEEEIEFETGTITEYETELETETITEVEDSTEIVTPTTSVISKETPILKSCIKDPSMNCNEYNTLCSLGINNIPAEIYGSQLLKIAQSPSISKIVEDLQNKYNRDIIFSCTLSNFVPGVKDYRYRSNENDEQFIKSFENTTTVIHLFGNITCQPKFLQYLNDDSHSYDDNLIEPLRIDEEDLVNQFTSRVKLENKSLMRSVCSLSGKSNRGETYLPLTDIKVYSYNDFNHIQIKDGEYIINNGMVNYSENSIHNISLSGCDERWLLNVTIGDEITSDC